MAEKIDNLDEIVNQITERVAEKLQKMGITPSIARDVEHCHRPDEECNHCGQCVVKKKEAVNNMISLGASRISTRMGVCSQHGGNDGKGVIDSKIASMIDHTLLKPNATHEDLVKLCAEARQYKFATVCVNSSNIPLVAKELEGSGVMPIAVVGFPLGAATPQAKAYEAQEAIKNGAREIDMVINIGALKSKDYKTVYEDIRGVVEASKPYRVKVILEMSDLDYDEKVIACTLSKTAQAAFVKTSTGFSKGGATVEDVALMRKIVGSDMEIKASGGIRTREDAEAMIKAGATRIGASASVAIVTTESGGDSEKSVGGDEKSDKRRPKPGDFLGKYTSSPKKETKKTETSKKTTTSSY